MGIQLPIDFINRMKEMLGEEYEDFISAYEDSDYHGLRINPLKAESKLLSEWKLRPVPWCGSGFYYSDDMRPGRHPYHHGGAYYIQEPSAMLVGELAAARPGMRVLDLCAAPGGKTGHIAGQMKGKGILVANEIVPQRARILSQNVERLGIRNCIVTNESPDRLAMGMSGYFDLVVVDAPCSGEGMFRRDDIAVREWSKENVNMCAQRGQDILEAADTMLGVGGRLVYSTCTFAPRENEGAIEEFLKTHPLYHIEKVQLLPAKGADPADGWPSEGRPEWSESRSEELEFTYRLWPHKLHGEGHFAAVLRKGEEDRESRALLARPSKGKQGRDGALTQAVKMFEEFAGENLKDFMPEGEYALFKDYLYLMPGEAPSLKGIRLERAGLMLGEIKKERFEPAHALAMALRPLECLNVHNIDRTDEETAIRYLCGESLSCDLKLSGWCLVTYDGISLGWGKAVRGQLKNHYPKGLRIMR